MFPYFWRYLVTSYLKVCFLSIIAFIAILLTSRLEEIARFASFGASFKLIAFFALYQIPYILPIAIPVGCLISSILLMKKLSSQNELTALRSAGFSISEIISPLLLTSFLLAAVNFYSVSELSTTSHLKANLLKNKLFSINPLLLLNNKHLMRMKGFYYDSLGSSKMGQSANEAIIVVPNQGKNSLNLILARELQANTRDFNSQKLSMVSPLGSHLMLETLKNSSFSIKDFSELIQKKVYQASLDSLNMGLLLLRLNDLKNQMKVIENPLSLNKSVHQLYSELARRLSAGLAPITFTLLGLSFGMSITRLKNSLQLVFPISLAALYLICFFAAKAYDTKILLSSSLYLLPQAFIIVMSFYKISQINRGIE